MRNLNLVVLNGRIGQDFTLKKTQNDKSVVTISLAVQYDKETTWVNVVAWNHNADALDRFCSKGSFIGVDGRLVYREWEGKDGGKKSRYEVLASSIYLLDPPKKDDGYKAKHDYQKSNGYQKQEKEDDIPF